VWILATARHPRLLESEAALQRYIHAWLRVQRLTVAPLAHAAADGLDALWALLAPTH